MSTNKVFISGKIVNIVEKGNVVLTTIASTKVVRDHTITEYPSIVWYGNKKDLLSNFKKWDRVYIEGQISTKIKIVNGDRAYFQNIIGNSIKAWVKMSDDMENRVEIEGVVRNVYTPNARVASIRVAIPVSENSNYVNCPNLVAYGNVADLVRNQIKVGDRVSITAMIETPKKKYAEMKKYPRESLVCQVISKID